jgi:hypothetical protein
MPDPATWGTVGQWVGGVGTTLAFGATFYVIRRDAKVRRYAQARKIVFYDTYDTDVRYDELNEKHYFDCIVKNLSDEPIYDVALIDIPDNDDLALILLPQEALTYTQITGFPSSISLYFRDNAGLYWSRSSSGNLAESPHQLFIRFRYIRLRHWLRKKLKPRSRRSTHPKQRSDQTE